MKTRVNEIDLNSRKTGKKDVNELEALENTGAILSRFFFFFLSSFYFTLCFPHSSLIALFVASYKSQPACRLFDFSLVYLLGFICERFIVFDRL